MLVIKYFRVYFFAFLLFCILSFAPKTFASTIINTNITENTTWTQALSPYIVSVPITVVADATLIIEPGVVVKFDYEASLYVYGMLDAKGTNQNPIYFTSYRDDSVDGDTNGDGENSFPNRGDWSSFFIQGETAQITLNHVLIRYSAGDITFYNGGSVTSDTLNSDRGISLIGSHGSFTNLTATKIEIFNESTASIDGATISNQDVDFYSSILLFGNSSLTLKNATIQNNGYGDVVDIFQNSTANFESVNIEGNIFSLAIGIFSGGSLNLNKSSINNTEDGLAIYDNSSVVVTDSSVSCANSGISAHDNATLNFSKGSVVCIYDGLAFYNEVNATIDSVKISGATDAGIIAYNNFNPNPITITKSEITDNEYSFVVFNTSISVNQNSIHDNATGAFAFDPLTPNQFDFTNNYWGDASGPQHSTNPNGLGDVVSDDILFMPFLANDPLVECCSNVLFLPGIKGSVLRTASDILWPPTILSNDIPQLALNENRESVENIYVNGILNSFKGTSIYSPFSSFMDELVADETIEEWLPMAYDWRFSPEQILENGIKTQTGTTDVLARIEELARDSKTGKVAIVSHSMGGLLGKAIIKKLEKQGKSNIIESFVMVGTPQLGTPQAIASMLHADQESILGGFIVHPAEMRAVGRNMPSAYNLLPSSRYFSEVLDPVIKFNPNASFTQAWRNFWSETISEYSDMVSFLTGTDVLRERPAKSDLKIPEVLRGDLIADAIIFHREYDNYQFPENIRVVQVAGWGNPTIKAVEYKTNHWLPSYEIVPTVEGDSTVVYPSAISSVADETYFFDLAVYNALENITDAQHRDLLSASPIQNFVKSIVKKENALENLYLRTTKPDPGNIQDKLIISTHSPVVLGAYDPLGNFTGIDPNQDLSLEILTIKQDIPGSAFRYTSESQYIFLPKEGNYNFVYKGIDTGPTTVKIDNFSADVTTPVVQYTDIPTTITTNAKFTVDSPTPEKTLLEIDTDGDGDVDETIYEDNHEFSLGELITQIKSKIQSLNAKDKLKQNLIKKIENLEKKIQKKNIDKLKNKQALVKSLSNLLKDIKKKASKGKVVDIEAQSLINIINQIENMI